MLSMFTMSLEMLMSLKMLKRLNIEMPWCLGLSHIFVGLKGDDEVLEKHAESEFKGETEEMKLHWSTLRLCSVAGNAGSLREPMPKNDEFSSCICPQLLCGLTGRGPAGAREALSIGAHRPYGELVPH